MCHECGTRGEAYRQIAERDLTMPCPNGHDTERVMSVPSLSIWDSDRAFPNAVRSGDGKFATRSAYESHLRANDMAEMKTDGKIKRAHGNRVVSRF